MLWLDVVDVVNIVGWLPSLGCDIEVVIVVDIVSTNGEFIIGILVLPPANGCDVLSIVSSDDVDDDFVVDDVVVLQLHPAFCNILQSYDDNCWFNPYFFASWHDISISLYCKFKVN